MPIAIKSPAFTRKKVKYSLDIADLRRCCRFARFTAVRCEVYSRFSNRYKLLPWRAAVRRTAIKAQSVSCAREIIEKAEEMRGFKSSAGFGERMSAAAAAKQAQLKQWNAAKISPDDPAFLERQAARQAIATARAEREAARKAAKLTLEAKIAADRKAAQEASEAQAIAEAAARAERERLEADQLLALEVERKAARDARYAARKARKS